MPVKTKPDPCSGHPGMLARYKIYRGKQPAGIRLPSGIRQDTRKHTKHCLRPRNEMVAEYLANPTPKSWHKFEANYLSCLAERWKADPTPFDNLAELASRENVYLGCSCPTANNPDVKHCHTVLALRFMKARYPELSIQFP